MIPRLPRIILQTMFVSGIILAPAIRADALRDLGDLTTIINSAAATIGAPQNESRPWGFMSTSGQDQIGTADLIQNITTTLLKANFALGQNQTRWLNATSDNPQASVNLTDIGLDEPYIEYVSTLPTLSTALITLGRSWHREMNRPVSDAISALEQTIDQFSTSLLTAGLVHSNSTLRTIRSSATLENAQVAWGRILNLPGAPSAGAPTDDQQPSGASISEFSSSSVMSKRGDDSDKDDKPTIVEITLEEALAPKQRRQVQDPPPALATVSPLDQVQGGATIVEITLEPASPSPSQDQPKAKRDLKQVGPNRPYPTVTTSDVDLSDGHRFGKMRKLRPGQFYSHQDLWGRAANADAKAHARARVLGEERTTLFDGVLRKGVDRRRKVKAIPFRG
ncbi:hypothetical protein K491DRAFT_773716 [Lophiostoma macrostomum CBS 122681]|uniref:Uncharacterized protein n=1 Tax=Lophiostoma macrostomum CBS 122681 TaxID=1314788 RepID=A0A6A6TNV6_9PLEO|nr:hypothetical protein K491DRAFT_773716 [Lophiostoma macrostomum CBS 122681]